MAQWVMHLKEDLSFNPQNPSKVGHSNSYVIPSVPVARWAVETGESREVHVLPACTLATKISTCNTHYTNMKHTH